jgi:2-oxoglutarate ferredoxin oxidoreductase subunit alpha
MIKIGFNILIGGKAGEGVDVTAQMLAGLAVESGWNFFLNSELHNVIKGYHNFYQVNVGSEMVLGHSSKLDLVIALDQETLFEDIKRLKPGGLVIHEAADQLMTPVSGIIYLPTPLKELVKSKGGGEVLKNVVAIGVAVNLLQADLFLAQKVVAARFKRKGEDVVKINLEALQAGYEYAEKMFFNCRPFKLYSATGDQKLMVSGNTMAALGAIKAGCKFFSAYPMTPSTSVLHYLAEHASESGMSVHHVEDELAAINMAIGAGYAGARAMTATSGGGYALMTEAVGFAGMAEIPVVILEVQRPGPSTGLPTRTGQGDLRQVLHAGQGDFPHIVLAPGTIQEAFDLTFEAFNLADQYQCPVTVLLDKYLGESWMNLKEPDDRTLSIRRGKLAADLPAVGEYKRYKLEADGISPRYLPGQADGRHIQASYEHGEDGFFMERPEEVSAMNEKRMRKIATCQSQLPSVHLDGSPDAGVTLICWGSTYGPAHEALKILEQEGIRANILQIKYLNPMPLNLQQVVSGLKHPILVEGNFSGQLGGLLREKTGLEIKDKILDFSGRPFAPEEISEQVKSMVK